MSTTHQSNQNSKKNSTTTENVTLEEALHEKKYLNIWGQSNIYLLSLPF